MDSKTLQASVARPVIISLLIKLMAFVVRYHVPSPGGPLGLGTKMNHFTSYIDGRCVCMYVTADILVEYTGNEDPGKTIFFVLSYPRVVLSRMERPRMIRMKI